MPRLGKGPHIVAFLLVMGLLGAMATQPTRQLMVQRERVAGMAGELDKVERSNARLERRIERYKDPDFIEQQARSQSGLVRPGETSIIVVPPSADKLAERRAARLEGAAVEEELPEPGVIESFLDFMGLR
jgi:cell division protein FtsB